MEKTKHRRLFKTPTPTNRSTDLGPINRLLNIVNGLTFHLLCIFSFYYPHSTIFSWNPQFFMPNAKGIFIFGQNLTIYLSICLYDAYDMKFMQLEGIFIKNSLSNH